MASRPGRSVQRLSVRHVRDGAGTQGDRRRMSAARLASAMSTRVRACVCVCRHDGVSNVESGLFALCHSMEGILQLQTRVIIV